MLMLRKACQPALDKLGLEDFFVSTNPHAGRVASIIGPCGKVLVSMNSIMFSRSTISKDERDYAVKLINRFLNLNGKVLVEYVVSRKALAEEGKRSMDTYETMSLQGTSVTIRQFVKSRNYALLQGSGQLSIYYYPNNDEDVSYREFLDNILPKLEIATKYSEEAKKRIAEEQQLATDLTKLSQCVI